MEEGEEQRGGSEKAGQGPGERGDAEPGRAAAGRGAGPAAQLATGVRRGPLGSTPGQLLAQVPQAAMPVSSVQMKPRPQEVCPSRLPGHLVLTPKP